MRDSTKVAVVGLIGIAGYIGYTLLTRGPKLAETGDTPMLAFTWENTGDRALTPSFRLDIKKQVQSLGWILSNLILGWNEGVPDVYVEGTEPLSVAVGQTSDEIIIRSVPIPGDWTGVYVYMKLTAMNTLTDGGYVTVWDNNMEPVFVVE